MKPDADGGGGLAAAEKDRCRGGGKPMTAEDARCIWQKGSYSSWRCRMWVVGELIYQLAMPDAGDGEEMPSENSRRCRLWVSKERRSDAICG